MGAVGCTLGIEPHMLAAVLGLSALLNLLNPKLTALFFAFQRA